MNNIKVLLVDDVDFVLASTRSSLKREFDVYTATNGKEALDILQSRKIDCLVTDINMPVMDGIELLKEINENGIDIKTIVIQGTYDHRLKKAFTGLKVDIFIKKPYLPNDLIKGIRTLLEY